MSMVTIAVAPEKFESVPAGPKSGAPSPQPVQLATVQLIEYPGFFGTIPANLSVRSLCCPPRKSLSVSPYSSFLTFSTRKSAYLSNSGGFSIRRRRLIATSLLCLQTSTTIRLNLSSPTTSPLSKWSKSSSQVLPVCARRRPYTPDSLNIHRFCRSDFCFPSSTNPSRHSTVVVHLRKSELLTAFSNRRGQVVSVNPYPCSSSSTPWSLS